MSWLRSALTDSDGAFDVAYVSVAAVGMATLGAIPFMCLMSAVGYFRCENVVREAAALIVCTYDPQPLGIAIGAACGGFATAIGALAAYMAATRRQPEVKQ